MENQNNEFAINIENATVLLKGKEILHNISWQVKTGAKYFILGANGSGKTTLVKTILGYIWPKYGANIKILGHKYGHINLHNVRKEIAWISPFIQKEIEPNTTGVDMVLSGQAGTLGFFRRATEQELNKVKNLLKELNGLHLANKDMSEMSSGEQMKIFIARALMSEPKLMIFDEPSVFLDIAEREFFLKILEKIARNKDLTVIFISQRIEDILPEFDYGMILKNGKIAIEGKRDTVLTRKNLKTAFNVDIDIIKTPNDRLWSVVKN